MIIALTTQGRITLARAVERLWHDRRYETILAWFDELPPNDRARLLGAHPGDVLNTALRAWRIMQPGLKRGALAAGVILKAKTICPVIERAQKELRENENRH